MLPLPSRSPHFPYTTLFRSHDCSELCGVASPSIATNTCHVNGQLLSIPVSYRFIKYSNNKWCFTILCRSEELTSELQSRGHLVCRLLLEKKKHNTLAQTHLS